ncbi:hypothetical protein JX265_005233 [Neoarthrinium moseri]|uniref:Integral membrane protein n=1 Tax=Neoarthrinium moseri TaxID=1658444 RepID=A0A9Q0ARS0_9PEZI|nr:hypothetical protein JX265_005233 [Neoarthrinium moseri]
MNPQRPQESSSAAAAAATTEKQQQQRPTGPVRPRQSAIRLRRLGTWRHGGHGPGDGPKDKDNPQQIRSMLDVGDDDRDRQSIRLNRLGSTTRAEQPRGEPSNPQPVRSMLDVDGHNGPPAEATDFQGGQAPEIDAQSNPNKERLGRFRGRTLLGRRRKQDGGEQVAVLNEYDPNIVDMLDVLDPEVSTLSSITNVQNSLFVPSMGRFINRQPTYNLSRLPQLPGSFPSQTDVSSQRPGSRSNMIPEEGDQGDGGLSRATTPDTEAERPGRPSVERIPSTMTERFYAVRPPNTSLADWSDEDLAELNDHVRHMLHSRRSAFRRSMKAFGQYVQRPLGFFVTLYAFLITVFGLAWVLFLIGWIYVGEKQLYTTNVIDNVLVALFAIVGDGLIPWRIVDTYHMIFIARYSHLTWKLREKMAVPDLKDKNDLPTEPVVSDRDQQLDLEAARNLHIKEELSVLTPQQQAKLEHHQTKFAKSHTFYKPHETDTHFAFPQRLLIAIVVLLDCHSCFQLALGLCTWCIDYRVRPGALTATILCCSIAVNITAGVLISIGDRRTRKKDVVERRFRQELTQEAMRRVKQRKEKEAEEAERKLHDIDEEDGKGASGLNLILPKPKLDFLHRDSDDSRKKSRRSADHSRKSLDQAGRFDTSLQGLGERSSSEPRVPGALPDEKRM